MAQLNIDCREALYIARQPVLDSAGKVFGYELLYRDPAVDGPTRSDDLAGTARVLTDAVVDLGLDTVTGGKPAFLRLTRPLLLRLKALLPPGGVVFELPPDVHVDDEMVDACRQLHAAGYVLGLTDFAIDSNAAMLLPYVKFIKVDTSTTALSRQTAIAREQSSSGVRLVAANIDSELVFDAVKAAGYHLFHGEHFSKPTLCETAAVPGRQLAYIRLLAALNKSDVTLNEIEDLVKHDVSLTYRVLRCINSAAFGMRREVHSIRQALLLLGLAPIRSWASVWCVAGLNTGGIPELVTTVLIRGRCCELLAERLPESEHSSEMFLVGLCSMLDLMLGRPMKEAVGDLPLSQGTRNALLGEPNTPRALLDAVIAYERGDWDDATAMVESVGLAGGELARAYTNALRWARDLAHE